MIRYLICLPLWLLVVIARYPAAVLAVLLYSSQDRLTLTRWRWLETIDNDLCGDSGWRAEHMIGTDPYAWYNRVGWLWRNGGNRFNYYPSHSVNFETPPSQFNAMPASQISCEFVSNIAPPYMQ